MNYQQYLLELTQLYTSIQESHKKFLKYYPLIWISTVVSVLLSLIAINFDYELNNIIRLILLIIFVPLGYFSGNKLLNGEKNLDRDFKEKFVKRVLQIVMPNSSYDRLGGFASTILFSKGSGIIKDLELSYFKSEDYIHGKINSWDIELCECLAEQKIDKKVNKIFEGIVIQVKLPLVFSYKLYIQSKNLANKAIYQNEIRLESLDWEKKFDTYCSDDVFARYILNPAVMQRILDLHTSHQSISLSFVNSHIYILWDNTSSFWEIKKQIQSQKEIENSIMKIFSEWESIISLVKELQLEREVWTKMQFLSHVDQSLE